MNAVSFTEPYASAESSETDRAALLLEVREINDALVRWQLLEWSAGLPPDERRPLAQPNASPQRLRAQRRRLLVRLSDLAAAR